MSSLRRIRFALLAGMVVACAGPTDAPSDPGFAHEEDVRVRVATDSSGVPLPPPQGETSGPGIIRGFVRGPGGSIGGDSLQTAPRLAGVVVRAYPFIATSGSAPDVISPTSLSGTGPLAATATTDASGAFQFPTLPGGRYKVSFQPPGGDYVWAWVLGEVSPRSGELPWWVTLSPR